MNQVSLRAMTFMALRSRSTASEAIGTFQVRSHSRNAAQENCRAEDASATRRTQSQLVKLSVLFDYPGGILGLTHVPEHAGAECEQILEVAVTAPCH